MHLYNGTISIATEGVLNNMMDQLCGGTAHNNNKHRKIFKKDNEKEKIKKILQDNWNTIEKEIEKRSDHTNQNDKENEIIVPLYLDIDKRKLFPIKEKDNHHLKQHNVNVNIFINHSQKNSNIEIEFVEIKPLPSHIQEFCLLMEHVFNKS